MFKPELDSVIERLRGVEADVAAHGGPTVPPANIARRDFLSRLRAGGEALKQARAMLADLPVPNYEPDPEPEKKEPKGATKK